MSTIHTNELHPELRKIGRFVPARSISSWAIRFVRVLAGRSAPGSPSGVDIVDTIGPVHNGRSVPVRIYLPEGRDEPVATLQWMHGGGLMFGTHVNDRLCGHLVRELDIAVVSPRYSLAPDAPYPAAIDDVTATAEWVLADPSRVGFDPARFAIGGASAGGGLAAALAQRMRDRSTPLRGQLLVYPMLDDRTAVRTDIGLNEHRAWTRGSNLTGWKAYLGTQPGGDLIPADAAPARRDDLSGLAPAWIGVGTLDLFLDECRDYAERLREAGVPCDLEIVDGAFHGFDEIAHDASVSQRFIESQLSFLRSVLDVGA